MYAFKNFQSMLSSSSNCVVFKERVPFHSQKRYIDRKLKQIGFRQGAKVAHFTWCSPWYWKRWFVATTWWIDLNHPWTSGCLLYSVVINDPSHARWVLKGAMNCLRLFTWRLYTLYTVNLLRKIVYSGLL